MKRIITPRTIFATAAATLLLFTNLVVVIGAGVILLAGWLDAGPTGLIVLGAIAAVPCCMAFVVIARMAFDAETDPTNQ
jgi:hypothetical protein